MNISIEQKRRIHASFLWQYRRDLPRKIYRTASEHNVAARWWAHRDTKHLILTLEESSHR